CSTRAIWRGRWPRTMPGRSGFPSTAEYLRITKPTRMFRKSSGTSTDESSLNRKPNARRKKQRNLRRPQPHRRLRKLIARNEAQVRHYLHHPCGRAGGFGVLASQPVAALRLGNL